MDFRRKEEILGYKIGKQLGFLFSFILFFSVFYYMLTKFHLKIPGYYYYMMILLAVYGIYLLAKRMRVSR